MLANVYKSTLCALKLDIPKVHLWSVSTITLHWINTQPHTLKTFVAHRVAEIQTHTQISNWRHVPTCDNPDDLISRGQMPQNFLNTNLWKDGPKWLSQDERTWPQLKSHIGEIPEIRKNPGPLTLKLTVGNWNFLEKYSCLKTLKHVLAYILRFIHNLKNKSKLSGSLSESELDHSKQTILKLTQQSTYSREILDLSSGKSISSKSDLLSLNPFLDDKGILKVGGRLKNANIPEKQKHPIVLPKNHHITKLIIREEHFKNKHAGAQVTLYRVRETYWPIDGRNVVRRVIRQCATCSRAKPRSFNYIMENLPKNRLCSTRPFLHTGVDYCGPFFIKEKRHRNRKKEKVYVSIFVCFATKAVHFELVGDLTSEAFIGCSKRFFSRRGKSKTIYSDNGTNFVGTFNELTKLQNLIQSTQYDSAVQEFLAKEKIDWRFSPPRSPHFGDLWEAAVKSFKHFVRTIGGKLLTYEQLQTVLHEIEVVLNSRPLTSLSTDPNDLLPLTPGHFLIGSPITSFPQDNLRNIPACRLSCWQYAQEIKQHFWDRWQREYLNHLINRSKWKSSSHKETMKIRTMVVLKEDNNPPMFWKLLRIIELHPGQDQVTRVVTVRTSTDIYKRNVRTLSTSHRTSGR